MVTDRYKYWAFISYSHRDKDWGDWLHRALETYRVPPGLVGDGSDDTTTPARLYPIFRDRDELPTASDLGASIREALDLSRCLIVVCSPSSANSRWVNEEVEAFRSLGRENRIIALLVAGEVGDSGELDPACVPPGLRHDAHQSSAAFRVVDARPGVATKADTRLALVAKLLALDLNDLKTQDRKRNLRRRLLQGTALASVLVAFGGIWLYQSVKQTRAERLARVQRFTDLGRQELLAEANDRALVYLAKAYELGGESPELRRMLGCATRASLPLLSLRHPTGVQAAQFSANGQRILTVDSLGTARVWDVASGRPLGQLDEPLEHARLGLPALDLEGFRVASIVTGNRVRTWKTTDGSSLLTLEGHSDTVTAACFSPNGQRILTGSHDGTAKLWDAGSGRLLLTLDNRPGSLEDVRFSPDGQRVLAILDDGSAKLWQVGDGTLIANLKKQDAAVETVAFSPDGARLVTAARDGTLALWNGISGELLRELAGQSYEEHEGLVVSISFTADGRRFLTVDREHKSNLWDAATGELLHSGESEANLYSDDDDGQSPGFGTIPPTDSSVAVSPGFHHLVFGTTDGRFEIRSPAGRILGSITAHTGDVTIVSFDSSGQRFLTAGSADPTLHVWQADQGSAVRTREGLFTEYSANTDASLILLTGALEPRAELWDVASNQIRAELVGHREAISVARFSNHGDRLVTVSADNTAKIWDATGRLIASLQETESAVVHSASYDRDGRRFLSVGDDGTAKVWDAQSNALLQTFAGRGGLETRACWSLDGTRVAIADQDGVTIWDVESGRKLGSTGSDKSFDASLDSLWDIAFSPDGRHIVTVQTHSAEALEVGTPDNSVADVWDASSAKHVLRLTAPTDLRSARFSPDGTRVWTDTSEHTSMLWDAATGRILAVLGEHEDDITDACFSFVGDLIATASEDGTAKVWNVSDGTLRSSLEGHSNAIRRVTFSPDGKLVATSSRDFTATIWDAVNGTMSHELSGHTDFVNTARFSDDGSHLVTAGGDGLAIVWDTHTGTRMATLKGHNGAVTHAEFAPDGTTVLTAGIDGTVRTWETASGKSISVVHAHEGPTDIYETVGLGPVGRRVATVHDAAGSNGEKHSLHVWDLESGTPIAVVTGFTDDVNDIAFSPDESQLATASDKTVQVWDAGSGKLLVSLAGHKDEVNSVAFSPDGTHLASASDDDTANVWDTKSGKLLYSLDRHTDDVRFVAFSPDGARIVTVDRKRTARVWDSANGKFLFDIARIETPTTFTPDSQILVASSKDEAGAWDSRSGDRLLAIKLPQQSLKAAVVSTSGNRIIGTTENTIAIWDVTPEHRSRSELASAVRCHLPLTLDEKGQVTAAEPDPMACGTIGAGDVAEPGPSARAGRTTASRPSVQIAPAKIAPAISPSAQVVATLQADRQGRTFANTSFSRNGERILITSFGTAKVWKTDGSLVFAMPKTSGGLIESAAFNLTGDRLATGSSDGTVGIWEIADGSLVGLLHGHTSDVLSIGFSADGSHILTSSRDGTARIWRAGDGKQVTLLAGHAKPVLSATFSANGDVVLTASEDGTARIWNVADGSQRLLLPARDGTSYFLSAVLSPDSTRVLTAAGDLRAVIWDAKSGKPLAVLSGDLTGSVAAFDPKGTRVVTGGFEGTSEVWNAETGEQLLTLRGHEKGKRLVAVSFSPDGNRILTASEDGTARLWESRSGKAIATLGGHTGSIVAAQFSPGGELALTADEKGTAKIWRLANGDG